VKTLKAAGHTEVSNHQYAQLMAILRAYQAAQALNQQRAQAAIGNNLKTLGKAQPS